MPKCEQCGQTFDLIDITHHHHLSEQELEKRRRQIRREAEERVRLRRSQTTEEVFEGLVDEEPSLEMLRTFRRT